MNLGRIAVFSVLSKLVKLLIAPLTIVVVASKFNLEQMGFYYTFMSIIAAQSLLEVGIGHVLKQHIAHSVMLNERLDLDRESEKLIKSYSIFTIKWFMFLSFLITLFIGFGGWIYFYDYSGQVEWKIPWLLLSLSTGIAVLTSSVSIIFEGVQNQIKLFTAQAISGIVSSILLIVSLLLGLDLYSLSVFVASNALLLPFILYKEIKLLFLRFKCVRVIEGFWDVFKEILPLLSRVSLIWIFGFFFWNSFNLIAFKFASPELAGTIGFSIALARAGYGISESVVLGQMTRFSVLFKSSEVNFVINQFKKFRNISLLMLLVGYAIFIVVSLNLQNNAEFLSKILPTFEMVQLFMFFTMTLLVTVQCNFIRSLKLEPFLMISIFRSISIPLVFYYMITHYQHYAFGTLTILMIFFYMGILHISRREILEFSLNESNFKIKCR